MSPLASMGTNLRRPDLNARTYLNVLHIIPFMCSVNFKSKFSTFNERGFT